MDKTADQIEAHIENTREQLGANLHELEQNVRSRTDWRWQFRHNPMTMLTVAFGGGILVAFLLPAGRSVERKRRRCR